MRECCDAVVRRETLEAREMDERPDLSNLERAEGGGARGGEGVPALRGLGTRLM